MLEVFEVLLFSETEIAFTSFSVGPIENAAGFPDQALKFWLQGYFSMPKKTRMGHHLKNFFWGPKMVCFGRNFGLRAQNSQNISGIRTKLQK